MDERAYYSRQLILKEVGPRGQEKIKNTRALIVGAGGLGHPCASYMASAGVGHLVIVDFDRVEQSNLNRQIFFCPEDVGKEKALLLARRIGNQNPYIRVDSFLKKISVDNVAPTLRPFDLILDCSDDLPTKFLLHDMAFILKKNLVQASLHQHEGWVQCFPYGKEKSTACLRCLWPTIPMGAKNCTETGLIGASAGILGTIQAFSALKIILGFGTVHANTTSIINPLDLTVQNVQWEKNPHCPLCSRPCGLGDIVSMHAEGFNKEGLDLKNFTLIDIRERGENVNDPDLTKYSIILRPLSEYDKWKGMINTEDHYLFICQKGIRSDALVKKLREEKRGNYFSLAGGIDRFSALKS